MKFRIYKHKKVNEQSNVNVDSASLTNDKISIGHIYQLTNEEDISTYANDVWNMLLDSYENVGGLKTYRSFKDFIRKKHLIEVVIDKSGNLLACATYRRIENSLKQVAIGCEQTEEGKLAIQQIIQHNIRKLNLHYWAEVSGAIEHYFKKHNGYPMPNILASEILQIDEEDIVLSNNDKVHYDRAIGSEGEMFTKMIFGIKNDEIFQKAIAEVENYGKFMKEVNSIKEDIQTYSIKQSIYIIENIYRAHEEDGFNELIPSWYEGLNKSLDTLKLVENPSQTILDYIDYAEYLLDDMQVLKIQVL
jgi:hypothetical protein